MKLLLPLLVLFAVGCAVERTEDESDGHVAETKEPLSFGLPTIPTFTPPPVHPLPPGTPLPVILPTWVRTCGYASSHFTVLANASSCQYVPGSGGTWTSRTLHASYAGSLCEVTWSGSASPDYNALAAIAKPEVTSILSPQPPAITAMCAATSVCDPLRASCSILQAYPLGDHPIEGMAGCSSCAFVDDTTLYAEIPADFASGTVRVEVNSTNYLVNPAGSQTFRLTLSAPSSGLARVYRF